MLKDICINRHQGNEQSLAANKLVNKERDRTLVLQVVMKYGKIHSKEIARILGKQLHQVSGRLSELKASNLIEDSGERIEGCSVLQLKDNDFKHRPIYRKETRG